MKCSNPSCSALLLEGTEVCPACGTDLRSPASGVVPLPVVTAQTDIRSRPESVTPTGTTTPQVTAPEPAPPTEELPKPTPPPASPVAIRGRAGIAIAVVVRVLSWVVVVVVAWVLASFIGSQFLRALQFFSPDFPRGLAVGSHAMAVVFGSVGVWGLVMRFLPIEYRSATRTLAAGGLRWSVSWAVGRAQGVRKTSIITGASSDGSSAVVSSNVQDDFFLVDAADGRAAFQVRGLNLSLSEGDTVVVVHVGGRALDYYVRRVDLNYYFPRSARWRRLVRGVRATPLVLWVAALSSVPLVVLLIGALDAANGAVELVMPTLLWGGIPVLVILAALIACPITRAINNRRMLNAINDIVGDALRSRR